MAIACISAGSLVSGSNDRTILARQIDLIGELAEKFRFSELRSLRRHLPLRLAYGAP
jgi:hypothetical protein